jgi:hypothetical protein
MWNSRNGFKEDDSLKTFLFTLKNPHNIPARRFALRAEGKQYAIQCNYYWGPIFGGYDGIGVSDDCNRNTKSDSSLGTRYTNDTGLDGTIVFTGSKNFQVKEIEFFEITN